MTQHPKPSIQEYIEHGRYEDEAFRVETYINEMAQQYAETLLWQALDDHDATLYDLGYEPEHFSAAAQAALRADCETFVRSVGWELLDGVEAAQAGHDLALTRNRHGAGFWDRGLGEQGKRLTREAHLMGEVDLWVKGSRDGHGNEYFEVEYDG